MDPTPTLLPEWEAVRPLSKLPSFLCSSVGSSGKELSVAIHGCAGYRGLRGGMVGSEDLWTP